VSHLAIVPLGLKSVKHERGIQQVEKATLKIKRVGVNAVVLIRNGDDFLENLHWNTMGYQCYRLVFFLTQLAQ